MVGWVAPTITPADSPHGFLVEPTLLRPPLDAILVGESSDDTADYRARLEARLGYGFSFALNGRDGMLTPYSEMALGAANSYRAGMNWRAGTRFDLTLRGECRESNSGLAEHAVLLKGEVRF